MNNKNKTNKTQAKSKAGSWIEGQVATMLESHARQLVGLLVVLGLTAL